MLWNESSETVTVPPASEAIIRQIENIDHAGDLIRSAGILPLLSACAMQEMRRHLSSDLSKEGVGLLLGRACYAEVWQRILVEVEIALPVTIVKASREHVSMLAGSWPEVWESVDRYPGLDLVGWFHSHPGHGIFLSAEDKKTQKLWFHRPWHIAVVMDPVRDEYGIFAGEMGRPVKAVLL